MSAFEGKPITITLFDILRIVHRDIFVQYKPKEALFLSFILGNNSTCFGNIYCPSSGDLILYSQQSVLVTLVMLDGFVGLVVTCWPLAPKFAGSNPAEAVGFFGRKNPQHAFLRRGSEIICPMSQLCGM